MRTIQILAAISAINLLLASCNKLELSDELAELSVEKSVSSDTATNSSLGPGGGAAPSPPANPEAEKPAAQTAPEAVALPSPLLAAENTPGNDTASSIPMLNVPTFNYLEMPLNTQPLFSKTCLLEDNPGKCSGMLLQKWLHKNLQYLPVEESRAASSVEYISFTIDEHGKVVNIRHAGTKGPSDEERAKAALEAVRSMPQWQAAIRNGKQVSFSVVLPVRFDVA